MNDTWDLGGVGDCWVVWVALLPLGSASAFGARIAPEHPSAAAEIAATVAARMRRDFNGVIDELSMV